MAEEFCAGIRSGLSYCGGHTIAAARDKAEFIRVAQSAKEREGFHTDHDWEASTWRVKPHRSATPAPKQLSTVTTELIATTGQASCLSRASKRDGKSLRIAFECRPSLFVFLVSQLSAGVGELEFFERLVRVILTADYGPVNEVTTADNGG